MHRKSAAIQYEYQQTKGNTMFVPDADLLLQEVEKKGQFVSS